MTGKKNPNDIKKKKKQKEKKKEKINELIRLFISFACSRAHWCMHRVIYIIDSHRNLTLDQLCLPTRIKIT